MSLESGRDTTRKSIIKTRYGKLLDPSGNRPIYRVGKGINVLVAVWQKNIKEGKRDGYKTKRFVPVLSKDSFA